MSSDSEHIYLLGQLLSKCSDIDLLLYTHQYEHTVFGSWVIVIGHSKERMKFAWDGKESYLAIAKSTFQNQSTDASWQSVLPSIGGTTTTPKEIFLYIYQKLCEHFKKAD